MTGPISSLFFRVFEIAYFEPLDVPHQANGRLGGSVTEAPLGMLIPLLIVAAGLVIVGMMTGPLVARIVQFAIPGSIV